MIKLFNSHEKWEIQLTMYRERSYGWGSTNLWKPTVVDELCLLCETFSADASLRTYRNPYTFLRVLLAMETGQRENKK